MYHLVAINRHERFSFRFWSDSGAVSDCTINFIIRQLRRSICRLNHALHKLDIKMLIRSIVRRVSRNSFCKTNESGSIPTQPTSTHAQLIAFQFANHSDFYQRKKNGVFVQKQLPRSTKAVQCNEKHLHNLHTAQSQISNSAQSFSTTNCRIMRKMSQKAHEMI